MIDTNQVRPWSSRARLLAGTLVPGLALWAALLVLVPLETASAAAGLAAFAAPVTLAALMPVRGGASRWAGRRGARLDGPTIDQLSRHLARVRVARATGIGGGLALNLLAMAAYNAQPSEAPWLLDAAVRGTSGLCLPGLGYALGTAWAELTKPRDRTGSGTGVAILARRQIGAFLDLGVRRLLIGSLLVTAGATLVWIGAGRPRPPWAGAAAIGPLAVSAVAWALAWWTCRRRERAADDQALAYEELTRTATANALAGTAIAFLIQGAAALLATTRVSHDPLWSGVAVTLLGVASIGIWVGCGTRLAVRSQRLDAVRPAR